MKLAWLDGVIDIPAHAHAVIKIAVHGPEYWDYIARRKSKNGHYEEKNMAMSIAQPRYIALDFCWGIAER